MFGGALTLSDETLLHLCYVFRICKSHYYAAIRMSIFAVLFYIFLSISLCLSILTAWVCVCEMNTREHKTCTDGSTANHFLMKNCVWKYQINKNEMLFVRNNWTEKKINKIIIQHILKVCTRTLSHTIAVTKKWAEKKMKISKLKRSKWAASKRQKRQQQTTTANNRQLRSTVYLWGDGNGRRAEPRKNRRKTIFNFEQN